MSPRELVILILGLAIVAVVLRGLFVALQARRGQIRLAIDKNIPRDVDLNALELAELPGGGARVVARSFAEVNRQNDAVATATANAAELNLGQHARESDPIPVLMDPVELRQNRVATPTLQPSPIRNAAVDYEDLEDDDFDDEYENETATGMYEGESTDEVLFDYDETPSAVDNLAQVIPDYPDTDDLDDEDDEYVEDDFIDEDDEDDEVDEEYKDDIELEENDEDDAEEDDDAFSDDEDFDDDEELDDDDSDDLEDTNDDLDDVDDDEDLDFIDDDLDEFSMTAGERIGYNPASRNPSAVPLQDAESMVSKPPKAIRKPLFAAFGRTPDKHESPKQNREAATPAAIITTEQKPLPAALPGERGHTTPVLDTNKAKQVDRAPAEPSEVVVLNVMAKPGREFAGDDLLHVLITSGLKFGEMNIFHRRLGSDNKGPVIFSVANILNPGIFDLNKMHEFSTLGVSLFLALPTPINNLEAFDQMFRVARQISESADGELRDDNRNLMTAQTIEHYRQRIRDFELRRLKAVGARG